jgi:hypothetical protein
VFSWWFRGWLPAVGVGGCDSVPRARLGSVLPVGGVGSGVGLLFEIWIVDASIFVVCCVHCHVWFICVGCMSGASLCFFLP